MKNIKLFVILLVLAIVFLVGCKSKAPEVKASAEALPVAIEAPVETKAEASEASTVKTHYFATKTVRSHFTKKALPTE